MDKRYIGALVSNAASLGHHWIYNSDFLEKESLTRTLVFNKQNFDVFERGKPSYYVYPKAEIGDFSTQGMFFKWLYEGISSSPNFSSDDYVKLLIDHIRPGGDYEGYIETYAKKLIIEELSKDLKLASPNFVKDDMHLVNFIPYMVCKIHNLSKDKAWDIAQVFTNEQDFYMFYGVLDYVLNEITKRPLKDILKDAIPLAPLHFQDALKHAIDMSDTKTFIKHYAGIACHLPHSLPLIFHILSHVTSYQEMVEWNTKIGGASSDRGLLLGFIMSYVSDVPDSWVKLTHL